MKKLMLVLSVIGMVALPARSYAGEMDVLLGKLVDKGILTAYRHTARQSHAPQPDREYSQMDQ